MEDKTINVNDEINKAGSTVMGFIDYNKISKERKKEIAMEDNSGNTIMGFIEQHPESLIVAAGAIFYVGYNIGRNKSIMDVLRIAAMSD